MDSITTGPDDQDPFEEIEVINTGINQIGNNHTNTGTFVDDAIEKDFKNIDTDIVDTGIVDTDIVDTWIDTGVIDDGDIDSDAKADTDIDIIDEGINAKAEVIDTGIVDTEIHIPPAVIEEEIKVQETSPIETVVVKQPKQGDCKLI